MFLVSNKASGMLDAMLTTFDDEEAIILEGFHLVERGEAADKLVNLLNGRACATILIPLSDMDNYFIYLGNENSCINHINKLQTRLVNSLKL